MKARDWLLLLVIVVVLVVIVYESGILRDRFPPQTAPQPVPASPVATGPYEIYFTQPVYPDRAETRHGGIDERFIAFVNSATRTLDIAVYDFDLENVAQAMAAARTRGVVVRMVTDSDTLNNTRDAAIQKALNIVKGAEITIVGDERSAIMHHKFAVRDGEEIWTGSWNFTTGDTYRLNNNAVRMRSPELARTFTAEFEQMFTQHKFGGGRVHNEPVAPVMVGAARVQAMFAPENGVAQRLAERIAVATMGVKFLAFSFTHDAMGKAVIERAQARVAVSGVFERTGSETRFSEYGAMKQAGLDVYQDGNPYVMHHKVFVLDGKTTVFGSFNFSDGADRDNDENCLIVDDPAFAARFNEEVDRMLAQAKSPSGARATPEKEQPR